MAAPRWYNTLIYGLGTSLAMYKTMRDFEMEEYANIVGGTFLCLTLYWTVEAELAWKEALRRAREAEEEEVMIAAAAEEARRIAEVAEEAMIAAAAEEARRIADAAEEARLAAVAEEARLAAVAEEARRIAEVAEEARLAVAQFDCKFSGCSTSEKEIYVICGSCDNEMEFHRNCWSIYQTGRAKKCSTGSCHSTELTLWEKKEDEDGNMVLVMTEMKRMFS